MRNNSLSIRDLGIALGIVVGVNLLGSAPGVLTGSDTGWIERPWFYPPEILFPIVWTLLFTLMGIALFLVWREGAGRRDVQLALGVFALQFLLNLIWTPVFFGLQRPDIGLIVIGGLWVAIALTIVAFARVRVLAAGLLLPYLAWVSFALVLNYAIYAAWAG